MVACWKTFFNSWILEHRLRQKHLQFSPVFIFVSLQISVVGGCWYDKLVNSTRYWEIVSIDKVDCWLLLAYKSHRSAWEDLERHHLLEELFFSSYLFDWDISSTIFANVLPKYTWINTHHILVNIIKFPSTHNYHHVW